MMRSHVYQLHRTKKVLKFDFFVISHRIAHIYICIYAYIYIYIYICIYKYIIRYSYINIYGQFFCDGHYKMIAFCVIINLLQAKIEFQLKFLWQISKIVYVRKYMVSFIALVKKKSVDGIQMFVTDITKKNLKNLKIISIGLNLSLNYIL